jgi:[protein-PII] uridylyltransferase
VEEALLHNKDLLPELQSHSDRIRKRKRTEVEKLKAQLPKRVDVYHELSLKRTILEIQTQDAIGLLYQVSRAIFDCGFDITFARIATERGVAMDTFYIEPINSEKGSETKNLLRLREAVNAIIDPDSNPESFATG